MKLLSFTLLLIATITLLVYTNPTMDDYSAFVGRQIAEKSGNQDEQGDVLSSLLSSVAGAVAAGTTTRRNFVVFSIYKTTSGPKPQECFGLLKNFFGCKDLASAADKSRNE